VSRWAVRMCLDRSCATFLPAREWGKIQSPVGGAAGGAIQGLPPAIESTSSGNADNLPAAGRLAREFGAKPSRGRGQPS
jgi:hypothetical protein